MIRWRVSSAGGYRAHAVPAPTPLDDHRPLGTSVVRKALCGARVVGDRKPIRSKRCAECERRANAKKTLPLPSGADEQPRATSAQGS